MLHHLKEQKLCIKQNNSNYLSKEASYEVNFNYRNKIMVINKLKKSDEEVGELEKLFSNNNGE